MTISQALVLIAETVVSGCKMSAKRLGPAQLSEAQNALIALSIVLEAVNKLKKELYATEEGRELLAKLERELAAGRPS